eukprot:322026-Pelagomonas_calceolata.AAC.1
MLAYTTTQSPNSRTDPPKSTHQVIRQGQQHGGHGQCCNGSRASAAEAAMKLQSVESPYPCELRM